MRMYKCIVAIILAFSSFLAFSGEWHPDEPTIANLSSTYAWAVKCSREGLADQKNTVRLGNIFESAMDESSWSKFKKQFQNSLHANKVYSIVNDKWLAYPLNREGCSTADNVVNMFIMRMTSRAE